MNNPLISVVIPVYNVEKYLRECVDSVLRQTYSNYEIILVDDGATDSSGMICDEYLTLDSRVKVIHQKNGGLSVARNTGLNNAKGDYIYFLDSDDYIEDVTLEHLVKCVNEEHPDFIFFDGYVFFDECEDDGSMSHFVRNRKYETNVGRNCILELLNNDEYRTPVQFLLLKHEYLIKNNLMFYPGILHEDELFTFLVYHYNGKCSHVHEQLYARRIRPGSIMTGSKWLRRYDSMMIVYQEIEKKYEDYPAMNRYLTREAKWLLGNYYKLEENDQKMVEDRHNALKKNIISHKGYGDIKLKIKCSKGMMNYVYRGQYKLMRMTGKA